MDRVDAPLQDTCALDPAASRPMFWMEMEHVACTSVDVCDSTLVNPRSSSAATTTHGRAGLENRRMLAISGASWSLAPNTHDLLLLQAVDRQAADSDLFHGLSVAHQSICTAIHVCSSIQSLIFQQQAVQVVQELW
jgi:hypothetical protein